MRFSTIVRHWTKDTHQPIDYAMQIALNPEEEEHFKGERFSIHGDAEQGLTFVPDPNGRRKWSAHTEGHTRNVSHRRFATLSSREELRQLKMSNVENTNLGREEIATEKLPNGWLRTGPLPERFYMKPLPTSVGVTDLTPPSALNGAPAAESPKVMARPMTSPVSGYTLTDAERAKGKAAAARIRLPGKVIALAQELSDAAKEAGATLVIDREGRIRVQF